MTVIAPEERLVAFRRCTTAEQYLDLLAVPYDEQVVNVNRLHILRLFANEIVDLDTACESPEQLLDGYREALARSYQAFTESTALDHRVFKVLKDRAPKAFVPVAAVAIRREEPAR